jgi:hypothetical protein
MKTRFPLFCFGLASLSAAAVLLTRVNSSAEPEKVMARTRGPAPAVTNPILMSVFSIPTNKVSGRDPFFPECDCGGKIVMKIEPSTSTQVGPSVALVFNGRSGTPERPLAIINGNTFEAGEVHDMLTGNNTRVPLKCVEIRENSVIVEIGGKQQELFLRGK